MSQQGPDPDRQYCLFDTVLGPCGVAWSEHGLTRLQLSERTRAATEGRLVKGAAAPLRAAPPPLVCEAVEQLERYFAGAAVDFATVALDLRGVPQFHRTLYDLMRALAWGETTSYGDLARRAGAPGAARAVGQAMGHNPIPIIIPCHRVLASGGKIGGFSAYGGAVTKERLLAMEGVHIGGTPLLPGLLPARR